MDNVIITPAEVIRLAFADGGYVSPEAIGEGDITAAAESARIELMRSLKVQAHAMLLRLTEYLDENAASIPEYDPRANVLKRCRTDGGFVQIF